MSAARAARWSTVVDNRFRRANERRARGKVIGFRGHIKPPTSTGRAKASADPNLKHGAVIWKLERGEGQFEGASGLITSNFTVSGAGEVTDNHFGVSFVR